MVSSCVLPISYCTMAISKFIWCQSHQLVVGLEIIVVKIKQREFDKTGTFLLSCVPYRPAGFSMGSKW